MYSYVNIVIDLLTNTEPLTCCEVFKETQVHITYMIMYSLSKNNVNRKLRAHLRTGYEKGL